jgi:hypothetical protein
MRPADHAAGARAQGASSPAASAVSLRNPRACNDGAATGWSMWISCRM